MSVSNSARIFRLFVSSTFSDFIAEREALQKTVFPELEEYCSRRGARFQAVDLRWGITEEAQREHDTMRICLEEVRRCQQVSPKPNFAVLLGDRYGWEPVPARIPQDHWKRLMKTVAVPDRELIEANYRPDDNAVPPVYCLCERAQDPDAFEREAQLLQALRRAARRFRGSARLPYFASATHQEIALGALSPRDEQGQALHPEQHVHVYVRHLSGLPQDESAKDFIDWDASAAQVTPGARYRLRGLERALRQRLHGHVHDLHTSWSRHGRDGAVNKAYLKRFCDAFLSHQKALIDAELDSIQQVDERQQREQAHQDFGAERARVFAGRQALLARIARYTETAPEARAIRTARKKPQAAPLMLLGGGGSGKSALLARAAQASVYKAKRSGAVVLQRYIGGVPGTESLMTTLTALTVDILSLYGQPEPPTPENAKALAQGFQAALGHVSASRPLFLFLDALDQLDKAESAWMLEWLPEKLPEHVRIVASARTGTSVEQSARRRYPRSLIDVPAMKPDEGRGMLKKWLADKRAAWFNAGIAPSKGRQLTPQQEQAVLAVFSHTGSALWLKLAYEEAATWASWEAPRELPATVQGLIEDLIDHRLILQENHPKVFTERALAYLTAGRLGLSENELSRALGIDKRVRTEFQDNEKTHRKWDDEKLLPPIIWSRLSFDLQAYLGLAQIDGALVMRWFHREFAEVLKSKYLANDQDRQEIHGALADTFLHLERELRPEETNDDALFKATDSSGKQVSAALRRVMEQPWQLTQAGRKEYLQALLTDFGFCMGKCAANRSHDLYLDLMAIDTRVRCDGDAQALKRFMRTRLYVLQRGDHQWPGHRILLQLATDYGQDNPVTRAAHRWTTAGKIDWTRLEKVIFLPETPRDGVRWVVSAHAHLGVRYDDGHLWSWDPGHLCLWDRTTGEALHIEALPTHGRLVPLGRLALLIASENRSCALYDPTTGDRKWERRFASQIRDAYAVGVDAVAVIDGVATHVIGLDDGSLRTHVSHEGSKLSRVRWRQMATRVLAGRWLTYQYAPRANPLGQTLPTKSFLAVHDLQRGASVFADDIEVTERPLDQRQAFLGEANPLGLRMAGHLLLLWTGQWWALDPDAPMLGLWSLDAKLRAAVPQEDREPDGIMISNWRDFVPVAWNDDFLVFSFAHLLVAWHIRSGRILYREIDPVLHRNPAAIRWSGKNTLVVLGHSRDRIVEPTKNFRWCLDDGGVDILRVPAMARPVLLAARGDVLVMSRDYRRDNNQGDYAQPEPLVAHNVRTGNSIVFHVMNRVFNYSTRFRYAWLDTGELVVIDGDHLMCLSVEDGVSWNERVETSLGSMLTVSEDWSSDSSFVIIGNERWMHVDLSWPSPRLRLTSHDFEWGAACELIGDELLVWEDDNGMSEMGMAGKFVLFRRDADGHWASDPATHMEALCVETLGAIDTENGTPCFDGMTGFATTQFGNFFLVGQRNAVWCFRKDGLELTDTLHGPIDAESFWIRGSFIYFDDPNNSDSMYSSFCIEGKFSPLSLIPRSSLLREGEVSCVNVRPFRDMATGPMRRSRLFVVGEPVEGWTAWDGAFQGQARDYVCFTGPLGQEVRWYGRHHCRFVRHRIDYASLPGRNLFEAFGGEGDVHSLVIDGQTFFVCEEDGSAWLVKLIAPDSKIVHQATSV